MRMVAENYTYIHTSYTRMYEYTARAEPNRKRVQKERKLEIEPDL